MTELADLSATELITAYRNGEASPSDAVQSCLDRIEDVEPSVNAILTLCADESKQRAAISTERWLRGDPRLLEGVPFGVKDIVFTEGIKTTGGSAIYSTFVPQHSATAVRRLEAAGGLLMAKLQTFEFATGDNSHYGPTRNPWDLTRTAGGSSAGSAAALAAREMPLAIGTDTGGSIRVPAALCGVTGLKPTTGRISRYGVMPLSWTLDHVGPMARSVSDVSLMLRIMAGYDARDPTSLDIPLVNDLSPLVWDLKSVSLGVPTNWFFDLIDPEIEAATQAALAMLEGEGAHIVEVTLPHAHLGDAMGALIMYAEAASLHEITFDRLDEYSAPLTQLRMASAPFVSARDYLRALRLRRLLQQDFEDAFKKADALIVPTMVSVAPSLNGLQFAIAGRSYSWLDVVTRLTMIFNLAGIPSLTVPSGFSRVGLPIGMQIVTRPLAEAMCLRIGGVWQQISNFHEAVPPAIERRERAGGPNERPSGADSKKHDPTNAGTPSEGRA